MTTRTLVMLSAAIEAATGIALIADPRLVAQVLLGTSLGAAGVAVGRVAGVALLSLAIACWPGTDRAAPHAIRALFTYNLLAALYLGYLRVGGGFASYLLWPAAVVHGVLALLLARPAFDRVSAATADSSK